MVGTGRNINNELSFKVNLFHHLSALPDTGVSLHGIENGHPQWTRKCRLLMEQATAVEE